MLLICRINAENRVKINYSLHTVVSAHDAKKEYKTREHKRESTNARSQTHKLKPESTNTQAQTREYKHTSTGARAQTH